MRDLKYVIVQSSGRTAPVAILFNGMINHCDMVPKGFNVWSAGFCTIRPTVISFDITVFGSSSSLKLNARIEDGDIIRKTLERTNIF